jgi:hypothetical protein
LPKSGFPRFEVVIPLAKFLPGLLTIAFVYNYLQDLIIITLDYLKYRQILVISKLVRGDTSRPES